MIAAVRWQNVNKHTWVSGLPHLDVMVDKYDGVVMYNNIYNVVLVILTLNIL